MIIILPGKLVWEISWNSRGNIYSADLCFDKNSKSIYIEK